MMGQNYERRHRYFMFQLTEKRIFDRLNIELPVRYSPQGSNVEFCSSTKNISGGGIRLQLFKKLTQGTMLDIEILKYNSDIKIKCRGEVVWIWDVPMDEKNQRFFEAGIKFIGPQLRDIGMVIN